MLVLPISFAGLQVRHFIEVVLGMADGIVVLNIPAQDALSTSVGAVGAPGPSQPWWFDPDALLWSFAQDRLERG